MLITLCETAEKHAVGELALLLVAQQKGGVGQNVLQQKFAATPVWCACFETTGKPGICSPSAVHVHRLLGSCGMCFWPDGRAHHLFGPQAVCVITYHLFGGMCEDALHEEALCSEHVDVKHPNEPMPRVPQGAHRTNSKEQTVDLQPISTTQQHRESPLRV